jgi:hypothetical protein
MHNQFWHYIQFDYKLSWNLMLLLKFHHLNYNTKNSIYSLGLCISNNWNYPLRWNTLVHQYNFNNIYLDIIDSCFHNHSNFCFHNTDFVNKIIKTWEGSIQFNFKINKKGKLNKVYISLLLSIHNHQNIHHMYYNSSKFDSPSYIICILQNHQNSSPLNIY